MGLGRAWERGPRTGNTGLGSRGGGGRSLPRLDSQDCRSPCACAAPREKKRGEKNFLPPGVFARGLPGANIAVVGGAGSECDPQPVQPPRPPGWARKRASLSKPPPLSGPGPGLGRGPRGGTGGLDPRGSHAPGLFLGQGGARLCAAGNQVGVSAPSPPQTPHLGTGSLHSIPSNFRGRGA